LRGWQAGFGVTAKCPEHSDCELFHRNAIVQRVLRIEQQCEWA
jgi:hypothetical protein